MHILVLYTTLLAYTAVFLYFTLHTLPYLSLNALRALISVFGVERRVRSCRFSTPKNFLTESSTNVNGVANMDFEKLDDKVFMRMLRYVSLHDLFRMQAV